MESLTGTVNSYHTDVAFECGSNYILTRVRSTYSAGPGDRVYELACQASRTYHSYETGVVNTLGATSTFLCPPNYAITGMFSEYSATHQDRQFRFRCSRITSNTALSGVCTYSQLSTASVQDFTAPYGTYLRGVYMPFASGSSDRYFAFYYCTLTCTNNAHLTFHACQCDDGYSFQDGSCIQGTQGPTGDRGIKGVQGAKGTRGVDGDKGAKGEAGADGSKGVKGSKGGST